MNRNSKRNNHANNFFFINVYINFPSCSSKKTRLNNSRSEQNPNDGRSSRHVGVNNTNSGPQQFSADGHINATLETNCTVAALNIVTFGISDSRGPESMLGCPINPFAPVNISQWPELQITLPNEPVIAPASAGKTLRCGCHESSRLFNRSTLHNYCFFIRQFQYSPM